MTETRIATHCRTAHNLINMGYYPTTANDAELISSHIRGYNYVILDPCCGTGEALETISSNISGTCNATIGVEIEPGRAEKAKEMLEIAINEDFFNLSIEAGSVGAVFLNPPYYSNEKLHQSFIEKSTTALAKQGVLILMIPIYELKDKTADFLMSYYENFSVFKSTDETFQQIIVIGTKRIKPVPTSGAGLTQIARNAPVISYNDAAPYAQSGRYIIPATKSAGEIKIISRSIDPEYLNDVLNNFDEDLKRIKALVPETFSVKRPLLPFRRGHLAQILASGATDGVVRHPVTNEKMLIKGTTTRIEETIEEDEEQSRVLIRDVVTILMMDPKGNIHEIK